MEWRLADARNRFSEVFNRALAEGPQRVIRREDAVIVLSERDYENLAGKRHDFKRFLLGKGSTLEAVDLTRDRSPMRRVNVSASRSISITKQRD